MSTPKISSVNSHLLAAGAGAAGAGGLAYGATRSDNPVGKLLQRAKSTLKDNASPLAIGAAGGVGVYGLLKLLSRKPKVTQEDELGQITKAASALVSQGHDKVAILAGLGRILSGAGQVGAGAARAGAGAAQMGLGAAKTVGSLGARAANNGAKLLWQGTGMARGAAERSALKAVSSGPLKGSNDIVLKHLKDRGIKSKQPLTSWLFDPERAAAARFTQGGQMRHFYTKLQDPTFRAQVLHGADPKVVKAVQDILGAKIPVAGKAVGGAAGQTTHVPLDKFYRDADKGGWVFPTVIGTSMVAPAVLKKPDGPKVEANVTADPASILSRIRGVAPPRATPIGQGT